MTSDGMLLDFPLVICNGKQLSVPKRNSSLNYDTVAATITSLEYLLTLSLSLANFCALVRALFFMYLRWVLFVDLHQHPLMVQSSSSKSHHSQGKSTRAGFKVGPPTKKPVAISIEKGKDMKQQSIRKYTRMGKYFLPLLSSCKSNVEFEQMKVRNLPRRVGFFF